MCLWPLLKLSNLFLKQLTQPAPGASQPCCSGNFLLLDYVPSLLPIRAEGTRTVTEAGVGGAGAAPEHSARLHCVALYSLAIFERLIV